MMNGTINFINFLLYQGKAGRAGITGNTGTPGPKVLELNQRYNSQTIIEHICNLPC